MERRREGTIIRLGFGVKFDKWLLPIFGVWIMFVRFWRDIWQNKTRKNLLLWGVDISQGSLAAAFLKFIFPRIPFVLTIQYGYGEERILKSRFGFIRHAFRFLLAHADAVSAISNYLLTLSRKFGYLGPAEVIFNGVAWEKFARNTRRLEKEKNNIPVLITTSRLVQKNGVDILIRAFAEVKKTISRVRLQIAGDGPERHNLEQLCKELVVSEDVEFLGSVAHEKIPSLLHGADLFVRASREEGMGNSFVEALASGLPIIGTPVGGIVDIIQDRKTGLLCRVDDPGDLAEKIIELLHNRQLGDVIATQGRKLVEEQFVWSTIVQSYQSLFIRTLGVQKKVLIATPLYPPDIGGPATYSEALLRTLPAYGIYIYVLPFSSVRRFPKIMRHVVYFWKALLRGRRVDSIFALDPVSVGLPTACAAWCARKPFVMKIVGDYAWEQGVQRFGVKELLDDFLEKKYGVRVAFLRWCERFSATRATRIIVPSRYLQCVVSQWGIRQEKIEVIYNSFDPPNMMLTREEVRQTLGISGFMTVSAGRLVSWKGFMTLIESVPEISPRIPDFSLIIIGSGPQEQKLHEKVSELHLEHRIKLLPQMSHATLLKYLYVADLFVLNTGYEGFSHALLEAMALNIPVITTDVGGNKELIEHKKNGIIVAYDSHEEIAGAVVRLYQDAGLRDSLVRHAEEKLKLFQEAIMIEHTAQFLKKI